MSRELSAEESKKERISSMGESLGELYHHLRQELVWLYSKWFEFVELFGKKPSRIDLMNEVSPCFFRIVQDVLWENIILGIARLTDPPKSFGKDNLTICKIPELITDSEFKKEIIATIEEAKLETNFCRDWRNRRFAHLDYLLSTNKKTKELELASREKAKKSLAGIAKVLNTVSSKFNNSTTAFEFSGGTPGNASSLLYYIYYGVKAEKEREERILKCKERPDDFDHPDL